MFIIRGPPSPSPSPPFIAECDILCSGIYLWFRSAALAMSSPHLLPTFRLLALGKVGVGWGGVEGLERV